MKLMLLKITKVENFLALAVRQVMSNGVLPRNIIKKNEA